MPYLALDLGVPLYATPFTAGLIRSQAGSRSGWTTRSKLHVIEDGVPFSLGEFTFRYMPLAHSIPEGNALRDRHALRPHLPHGRLEARR